MRLIGEPESESGVELQELERGVDRPLVTEQPAQGFPVIGISDGTTEAVCTAGSVGSEACSVGLDVPL